MGPRDQLKTGKRRLSNKVQSKTVFFNPTAFTRTIYVPISLRDNQNINILFLEESTSLSSSDQISGHSASSNGQTARKRPKLGAELKGIESLIDDKKAFDRDYAVELRTGPFTLTDIAAGKTVCFQHNLQEPYINYSESFILPNIKLIQLPAVTTERSPQKNTECICLENNLIKVKLTTSGQIFSLLDKRCNPHREIIYSSGTSALNSETESSYGNNLVLYDDIPFYWDAWYKLIIVTLRLQILKWI
jgi:hypothetical protein